MKQRLAHLLIGKRNLLLLALILITGFMVYKSTHLKMQYQFVQLLPDDDPLQLQYEEFRKDFGQDGNSIFIATTDTDFYTPKKFDLFHKMGLELSQIYGIDTVISETNLISLIGDDSLQKFSINKVYDGNIPDIDKMDSIKEDIEKQLLLSELVFNQKSNYHLMIIALTDSIFNSKHRKDLIQSIDETVAKYESEFDGEFKRSGLSHIRHFMGSQVQKEIQIFAIIALIICASLLLIFYRSKRVIFMSSMVVIFANIWTLGWISIFNYEVDILLGMVPTIIIIIGIPNCVYFINKFQQEYLIHRHKKIALINVIYKIGGVLLITNLTTAFGFLTFIFTNSEFLIRLGIIAPISIISLFFITLIILITLNIYFVAPEQRQVKHLENKYFNAILEKLVYLVSERRKHIFIAYTILFILSGVGISLMYVSGKVTDDVPAEVKMSKDLRFFEKEVKGVLPLEIIISSKKKNEFTKSKTLKKIDKIQKYLKQYQFISKPLSLVDVSKYLNQALFKGDTSMFKLPNNDGRRLIKKYIDNSFGKEIDNANPSQLKLLDSSQMKTRISLQIADIGTDKIEKFLEKLNPFIDSILNPKKVENKKWVDYIINNPNDVNAYDSLNTYSPEVINSFITEMAKEDSILAEKIYDSDSLLIQSITSTKYKNVLLKAYERGNLDYYITGTSIIFAEGTNYLVQNLLISISIAILFIAILMAILFRTGRMVFISLLPNFLPLLLTAAFMGFIGLAIKPSSLLVFSIAFGIAVDDAIHYLAKYRQELKYTKGNIKQAVINSIQETGLSMMYTSVILFCGFGVFLLSTMGSTQALGILVSFALILAMIGNLTLLPALLLQFEKKLGKNKFIKKMQ